LALYGLAAILEETGHDVRLSWTAQHRSRPHLHTPEVSDETIGAAVKAHATHHTSEASWVCHDVTLHGTNRGLMSPRLTAFGDPDTWKTVQQDRHGVL